MNTYSFPSLAGLMALLVLAFSPLRSEPVPDGVLDTSPDKVVVAEATTDPGGRFALGWTLRPKTSKDPAVDWSLYDPQDPLKFLMLYGWNLRYQTFEGSYDRFYCMADLQRKATTELPSHASFQNDSHLTAAWNAPVNGWLYGLVTENGPAKYVQFAPLHLTLSPLTLSRNIWLAVISGDSVRAIDIRESLENAINPFIRERKPYGYGDYYARYSLRKDDASQGALFKANEVEIPWAQDITYGADGSTGIKGTVTLRLADWHVLGATCTTPVDDPLKSVAALVRAVAEEKDALVRLSNRLNPKQQAELKGQESWFERALRPEMASSAADEALRVDPLKAHLARDKALLDLTVNRTKELQERLAKIPAPQVAVPAAE